MKQSNIKGTAVYLRVATPCHMGIWTQETKAKNYLREVGDTKSVTYFRDNGFSGCTFERPAFQDMLGQVVEGTISKIVIVSLSRLARGYLLMVELLHMLNAYGVQLVSLDESIEDDVFLMGCSHE